MTLTGKLVAEINIKSHGDLFHKLFRDRPHQIPGISPDNIHACELHDGQSGTVGSIVYWEYAQDGKKCVAKDVIEEVNEETKSVTFKVIEGDLMEHFSTFKAKFHVDDTSGDDHIVTWTLEYEKKNEGVADPHPILDLCRNLTKDIETHGHKISSIPAN